MQEPKKEKAQVGVSVLVKKGDRILLEKRQHTSHGNGTWGPPSGHIDFGEAPEQTAIRETYHSRFSCPFSTCSRAKPTHPRQPQTR